MPGRLTKELLEAYRAADAVRQAQPDYRNGQQISVCYFTVTSDRADMS
jgi:hypothetical protein